MTSSEPRWLVLLRLAVQTSTIAKVARGLGYSRTAISLVLAGKYPGKTNRIEASVLAHLEQQIVCPYLGVIIGADVCHQHINAPAPTHNPLKLAHWRSCQQCPHRPGGKDA